MAGKARAKKALNFGRDSQTGRYLSPQERADWEENYYTWLYEKPGRAGGVERAITAIRDRDGCFRGTLWP